MAKAKLYKFQNSKYTMRELAELFELSYCRMSNLMNQFKGNANAVFADRQTGNGSKSGKSPRTYKVGLTMEKTVAEISAETGYSKAAISGKIKRGVKGSDLLEKKRVKPLYAIELKEEGSVVKKLPNTVRADKNRIGRVAVTDIDDKLQIRNAMEDYVANGGTIEKVASDGTVKGNSWKAQAKRTWKKRVATSKKKLQVVVDEQGEIKGGKMKSIDVDTFIQQLEAERDQRKAAHELMGLEGIADSDIAGLNETIMKDGIVRTET